MSIVPPRDRDWTVENEVDAATAEADELVVEYGRACVAKSRKTKELAAALRRACIRVAKALEAQKRKRS